MLTYWVCDGTFKIAPQFACKLYTRNVWLSNECKSALAPAIFALTAMKTKTAYKDLLYALRDALPQKYQGPHVISCDFQLGVNAK